VLYKGVGGRFPNSPPADPFQVYSSSIFLGGAGECCITSARAAAPTAAPPAPIAPPPPPPPPPPPFERPATPPRAPPVVGEEGGGHHHERAVCAWLSNHLDIVKKKLLKSKTTYQPGRAERRTVLSWRAYPVPAVVGFGLRREGTVVVVRQFRATKGTTRSVAPRTPAAVLGEGRRIWPEEYLLDCRPHENQAEDIRGHL